MLVLTGANVFGQLMWGAGGTGGSGQWSSVNQNWWNGSANVSWPGGEAIFAGAAGTVSISSNVSAEKLDFNAPGYVLDSGTLNAGTGTLTVEANADAVINSAMYGSSFGSFNLVKTGAASVTLTGSVTAARMTIGAGDLRVAGS